MGYTLQYYDLVLACIAASLAAGFVVGYATPIAFELSVTVFAVVAIGFVVHAMFVNGPVDELEDLTEEVEPEDVPAVLSPLETPE
ncbi:hypothetical protein [Halostagnicola sp. A-GB9-2]|uniref:hypothetical protein n=1 Tax=Halostagnicola sp. A-GB9-2 TaxID=3048066 RepID=UPI0024BF913F|nr:hypothetical protein [Halostagnicola sp. A-GB9-2]MDJ1432653.1 hypothetical protein [Halostagnicola sp. A-GB9-2]